MRLSYWLLVFAVSGSLASINAPAATLNQGAQPAPVQEGQPQGQPAKPARLLDHSETSRYDNWVVTCQEFADAPKKHVCSAVLRAESSGGTPLVFVWTLFINDKKQLIGVVQTPTGVMLSPGVEIELAHAGDLKSKDAQKESRGPKHKFAYESCEPGWCAATLGFDTAFIREAMASENATVVIQAVNGNTVRFNFPNKGFDKAYAQLRANAN